MKKERLDVLLVERGLAESRSLAQRLVMAGQVRVDGQMALKPSLQVAGNVAISIDRGPRYVSRGGEKLAAALQAFAIDVNNRVCADVGASTGGFTDCLLQNGASRVYAIDVGHGILDWKLRNDRRVFVMEGTNARFVEKLPEVVTLVTVDASFISLGVLLPVVRRWYATQGGELVALVKPQFEAGRSEVARGKGVIRDAQVHRRVLLNVLDSAHRAGFGLRGLLRSPLLGPKGNAEFLAWWEYPQNSDGAEVELLVSAALSAGSPEK